MPASFCGGGIGCFSRFGVLGAAWFYDIGNAGIGSGDFGNDQIRSYPGRIFRVLAYIETDDQSDRSLALHPPFGPWAEA